MLRHATQCRRGRLGAETHGPSEPDPLLAPAESLEPLSNCTLLLYDTRLRETPPRVTVARLSATNALGQKSN
eukprot:10684564-Alexandrium_andersonii.AAC.1